jgi:predicted MFS family arabinose efflux permease
VVTAQQDDGNGNGRPAARGAGELDEHRYSVAASRAVSTVTVEELEDAEVDGDRPFNPGTARAALSYSGFRRVFTGYVLSSVGSWMQNVVLNAYAYDLTGSATFVGLMNFATLGPMLVLSLVGGSLADRLDRRRQMIWLSIEQAIFAFALAAITLSPNPAPPLLLATVFAINIGQALINPVFSAALPSLVARRDLPGAVSLMSGTMNLSRVLGAAIGPIVYLTWGVSWVFLVNAVTYFFMIGGIWSVDIPSPEHDPDAPGIFRRIAEGFRIVSHDIVLRRIILSCAAFSLFGLSFIGLMPVLASTNLGISAKSTQYAALYSIFGLGAMVGAFSIGTFLAGRDLTKLVRIALAVFAVMLAVFSLWRSPLPAYPTAFIVGFWYFMAMTSLSTILQERVDDRVRGRVMSIWLMAFGGTVALGPLLLAPVADHLSITFVLMIGAVVAACCAWYARLGAPTSGHVAGEPVG